MQNNDQRHLPERSWGREIPPVPLLRWLWLLGCGCSAPWCRAIPLFRNSQFEKTFSTGRKMALEEGEFIPTLLFCSFKIQLEFTHGNVAVHGPAKGRAAVTPTSSMGSPQSSWLARRLWSKNPRLSQAGVSSWFCFEGIQCNLDVGQPGFVALLGESSRSWGTGRAPSILPGQTPPSGLRVVTARCCIFSR